MNDNADKLIAGILIHDEIQRRNDEKRADQEIQTEKEREKNESLNNQNSTIKKQNSVLNFQNDDLHDDIEMLQGEVRGLYNKALELQEEVDTYKKLLCKPMAEIAEKNNDFKGTYNKQMEIMAEWMVSQKAFKELAIQFGLQQGLSVEEVIQQGVEKEMDVLESKHDSSHNTNANSSNFLTPKIEQLKEKIHNKKKK